MGYEPERSLNNAVKLLDARDIHHVISLRIEPDPRVCCCSDCWPLVWNRVNALIYPQGPVEHEGQVLVEIGHEKYILEQHESGPEVLLLITASINLIAAVMNLIVAVSHSLEEERRSAASIKIIKRRLLRKRVTEELLVELSLRDKNTSPKKIKGMIETVLRKALASKK